MFSTSERIIQDHVRKYKTKAAELKDLIQEVLHHPDFDVCEDDTNMHERSGLKVLRELLADARLAGRQHFAFKEYKNARGGCIIACDANSSLTFQLAQIDVGPGKVPISIVLYIDGTFIKRCIPI
jgi:CheY-like chemotaxis protein